MTVPHKVPCIYCPTLVDPSKGAGDHVIPAALGEFRDDRHFMRICPKCNRTIGRCEEQMLRCGPEWLFRQVVVPKTARGRGRRKASVGSQGVPPPRALVHTEDGKLAGRPTQDVRSIELIDQLVIHTEDGQQIPLQLHPDMTAQALLRKVKSLGVAKIEKTRLSCSEDRLPAYRRVAQEAWPQSTWEALLTIPAGRHEVTTEYQFRVTDHYFRAIATIAFHYYLTRSQRARGDEESFAPIRQFIMEGGKIDRFVSQDTSFFIPMLSRGYVPCRWHHIVAADETTGNVLGYVCLFIGPQAKGMHYQVKIGNLNSRLVMPSTCWAHGYDYDDVCEHGRTVGSVSRIDMTRYRVR